MVARLTALAAILFILILALAACAAPGTLCSVGPFQPSPGFAKRLTRAEKQQVYVWNRSGEDVCGWQAP